MNIPNRLTLLRILLIPVFIVFASLRQISYAYLIACAVFSVASFTDFLDGYIARKRGIVTDFGKFSDPLADKILTTTAFIYMMLDGVCHPLVLVLIITREFAVSGVRMVAAAAPGGKVIAASLWGKVKTVCQMVTVIVYYLAAGIAHVMPTNSANSMEFYQLLIWLLCWGVAAVTAISGFQYIWVNREYINTTK